MNKFLKANTLITSFLLLSSLFFIANYRHLFEFTPQALGKYFPVKWVLMAHIAGGATALLSGPFQFLKSFREKRWKLHRRLGYVYLGAITLSATGALWLTFTTTSVIGISYTLALRIHIFIWILCTFLAYWTIIRKRIQEHEQWMVRSYITTFAFILQNFMIIIPAISQLGTLPEIFPNVIWVSWSVPLIIYQAHLAIAKMPKVASRVS